jgi:AAHS family 4-hydroxybenzoate transporter-like MFS transporter
MLGRLIDRRQSFGLVAWAYLGASVSMLVLGATGAALAPLAITVFVAGFFVIGAQNGANVLAAEFYPTAIRSTGVGWALGVGRIGSIVGPTLGGYLLAGGGGPRRVFWAAALPPLVAMIAAFAASILKSKESPK